MLEAANKNYASACYDVGVSYELGQGARKNYKKAFEYYLKGHLLGDKQSMYEVGRCYHFGIGVKADKVIASYFLDIAVDVYGLK